jgi:DNA-binding beta-propeller fold protein YncE
MVQKIIIASAVALLLVIVFLLGKDFFSASHKTQENYFGYDLEKYKAIDSTLIHYHELNPISHPLAQATGIAFCPNGNMVVCGGNQWAIYNIVNGQWQVFNTIEGAVCLCSANNLVYVASHTKIAIYNFGGQAIKTLLLTDSLPHITSIAHSGTHLFVADAANKKVVVFDTTFAVTTELKPFIIPSMCFDLAIDPANELWVANPGKHSLQNYTNGLRLITAWGNPGIGPDGFAGCCNPAQFAMLADGSFVTYEKGLNRIKILNRGGFFQHFVAGAKQLELNPAIDAYNMVSDIAVSHIGQIVIVDKANALIRVFEKNHNNMP